MMSPTNILRGTERNCFVVFTRIIFILTAARSGSLMINVFGKPVRIDIKGKTMEKLSTTTNMKKASPYLSYINDKIFYAVMKGKKNKSIFL